MYCNYANQFNAAKKIIFVTSVTLLFAIRRIVSFNLENIFLYFFQKYNQAILPFKGVSESQIAEF